jgi:thiamine-monophosphate kinase
MARAAISRPGEFELIARYFRPLARSSGAFALTDDAALVSMKAGEELVITCDAIAEGVHFFRDDPPQSVAQKALRVNLSDLAAKGATPFAYLMALALPPDWTEPWLRKFAAALAADEDHYGVSLLGGDTIRAAGGVTVSITALGSVPKGAMVLRSGARVGDAIMISGTIGDAALGLRLRRGSVPIPAGGKFLLDRYLRPQPRVELVPALRRYATSAIDVSDGLIGDLAHICETSGVGATVALEAVPLSPPARRLAARDPSALALVLNGGDDYEILATVAAADVDAFARAAGAAGVAVTRIGSVEATKGHPIVTDASGRTVPVARPGHTHF